MKYESQEVAYWYILAALALFAIQVLGGLIAGWIYVAPNFLSELLPFNVIRMIHTNALIVWLLLGFFGAAFFLVPEEAERDIWSPGAGLCSADHSSWSARSARSAPISSAFMAGASSLNSLFGSRSAFSSPR